MYPLVHTALSVAIQSTFPGIVGILMCLPAHYALDSLVDEEAMYGSVSKGRTGIFIELSMSLDVLEGVSKIEDEKRRNDYALAILVGTAPDVIKYIIPHDHNLLGNNIMIGRDIGPLLVGAAYIGTKLFLEEERKLK